MSMSIPMVDHYKKMPARLAWDAASPEAIAPSEVEETDGKNDIREHSSLRVEELVYEGYEWWIEL
ncbi:hypothetical protein VTL71DRAFT_173 [Oculimacula yallundae]|uniref:Uncharacterized protein n=1 Tax=Oculimacula yallundae TaxID=86028 RepID=A0ABR4CZD2_9HELO